VDGIPVFVRSKQQIDAVIDVLAGVEWRVMRGKPAGKFSNGMEYRVTRVYGMIAVVVE